jgi:hypothetical protein
MDLKGVSLMELPLFAAAGIAWHFRSTYFTRSASFQFINVPKIVQIALKFLYNFVDDF